MNKTISSVAHRVTPSAAVSRIAARLRQDRRGAVAVFVAMATPVLVGMASLAIDVTRWESVKLSMQTAADHASIAAAAAEMTGKDVLAEARALAALNGFVDGEAGATVSANRPPLSGIYAGNSNATEVIISQPAKSVFGLQFVKTPPTLTARSVSIATGRGIGGLCILALAPSVSALRLNGQTLVDTDTCNVYVNSSTADALYIDGKNKLYGYDIKVVGKIARTGEAEVKAKRLLLQGANATQDPYSSRIIPDFLGCDEASPYVNKPRSFSAGAKPYVICGGMKIDTTGTVTFGPGIYIFDTGSLTHLSSGTIEASGGVTFIFTSKTGLGIGGMAMSGTGKVNMRAPSSGPSAGIAIWMDKRAPHSTAIKVAGGQNWTVAGAVYAPSGHIDWAGTASSSCTQFIAYTISLSGNVKLKHDCAGVGISDPSGSFTAAAARVME